jgi:hypothetical protein
MMSSLPNAVTACGALGYIGRDRAQIIGPSQFRRRAGKRLAIDVRNHDLDAVAKKSFRASLADAARRTGNHGDLAR